MEDETEVEENEDEVPKEEKEEEEEEEEEEVGEIWRVKVVYGTENISLLVKIQYSCFPDNKKR